MGFGDLFKLSKLTITPYRKAQGEAIDGTPFEVQYNPESLSIRYESVFKGEQGGREQWAGERSKRLNVDLILDGTKVDYMGIELLRDIPTVAERIDDFLKTCYDYVGKIHEPYYLKITWNKDVLKDGGFPCRLESVDVRYVTFNRDGSPLHAVLSCAFVEALDRDKALAKKNPQSPDLTHRRVVLAGDTLPNLCRDVYGSAAHYLRVAQVNGLDDFRRLTPGQELVFPPFDKKARRS